MSEIRYNLLDDRYVIIAPERLHRPDYMAWRKEEHIDKNCPFCEGNEVMTPSEIYAIRSKESKPNATSWKSRVVPNLYKAVQIEAPNHLSSHGIYSTWEGFGAHEVIIDTPLHHHSMVTWSSAEYYYWLSIMQQRLRDLRGDVRLLYISLFKNHGVNAGATQSHPHTQLIALPVVPKSIVHFLERNYRYFQEHGRGIVESIITQEEHDGIRIIATEGIFFAFCPYASSYPFEVMIVTRKEILSLEQLDIDELRSLSTLLQKVFGTMSVQLGNFDFNLSFLHPPMHRSFDTMHLYDHRHQVCRFVLRITPRIYRHGGFELSTETMINPVAPEECATLLKVNP